MCIYPFSTWRNTVRIHGTFLMYIPSSSGGEWKTQQPSSYVHDLDRNNWGAIQSCQEQVIFYSANQHFSPKQININDGNCFQILPERYVTRSQSTEITIISVNDELMEFANIKWNAFQRLSGIVADWEFPIQILSYGQCDYLWWQLSSWEEREDIHGIWS